MHHVAITAQNSAIPRGFSLTAVLKRALAIAEVARQRRALGLLEDDRLADLGLSRADVRAELQKPFWA